MCEMKESGPVGGGGGWICIGRDLKIAFSWVSGFDFGVDKEANLRLFAAIDESGTRDEGRERLSIAVSDRALSKMAELASEAEEVGCHRWEFEGAAELLNLSAPPRTLSPAAEDDASVPSVRLRAVRG